MTFGWVRSRFRFLSSFLIVSLLSSDILWANPAVLGPAVDHSVYLSFSGFGQIVKISSQDSETESPDVCRIFGNLNFCSVSAVPIDCARVYMMKITLQNNKRRGRK